MSVVVREVNFIWRSKPENSALANIVSLLVNLPVLLSRNSAACQVCQYGFHTDQLPYLNGHFGVLFGVLV